MKVKDFNQRLGELYQQRYGAYAPQGSPLYNALVALIALRQQLLTEYNDEDDLSFAAIRGYVQNIPRIYHVFQLFYDTLSEENHSVVAQLVEQIIVDQCAEPVVTAADPSQGNFVSRTYAGIRAPHQLASGGFVSLAYASIRAPRQQASSAVSTSSLVAIHHNKLSQISDLTVGSANSHKTYLMRYDNRLVTVQRLHILTQLGRLISGGEYTPTLEQVYAIIHQVARSCDGHPNIVAPWGISIRTEDRGSRGSIDIISEYSAYALEDFIELPPRSGKKNDPTKQTILRDMPLAERLQLIQDIFSAMVHLHNVDNFGLQLSAATVLVNEQKRAQLLLKSNYRALVELCHRGMCQTMSSGSRNGIYMSPEELDSDMSAMVGPACDIYAAGRLMWVILAGAALPFANLHMMRFFSMTSKAGGVRAIPTQIHDAAVPFAQDPIMQQLCEIMYRCCQFAPVDRPTAIEIFRELEQIQYLLKAAHRPVYRPQAQNEACRPHQRQLLGEQVYASRNVMIATASVSGVAVSNGHDGSGGGDDHMYGYDADVDYRNEAGSDDDEDGYDPYAQAPVVYQDSASVCTSASASVRRAYTTMRPVRGTTTTATTTTALAPYPITSSTTTALAPYPPSSTTTTALAPYPPSSTTTTALAPYPTSSTTTATATAVLPSYYQSTTTAPTVSIHHYSNEILEFLPIMRAIIAHPWRTIGSGGRGPEGLMAMQTIISNSMVTPMEKIIAIKDEAVRKTSGGRFSSALTALTRASDLDAIYQSLAQLDPNHLAATTTALRAITDRVGIQVNASQPSVTAAAWLIH